MSRSRQALEAAVGEATQTYQRAVDGFDDLVGRELGLNRTDLRCLDWLTGGEMSASALGQAAGISSAGATTMLDRLERKGYVARARDTADRRKVLVALTPRGRELIGRFYGPLAEEGGRLLSRFSEADLRVLRDFLRDATDVVDRHAARVRTMHEAPPTGG